MKVLFAIIAIIGYICNINKKLTLSYSLWLTSNTSWAIYNFIKKEYAMGVMFLTYNLFCFYGIIKQNKKKKNL